MSKEKLIAAFFFALSAFIALEQYANWNVLFSLSDIHHETFIVAFAFAGLVLWFLPKMKKIGRKS